MRGFVFRALALWALPGLAAAGVLAVESGGSRVLLSGDQLHQSCLEKGADKAGVCRGYVAAVIDLEHLHSELAERAPLYCIPEDLELSELSDRVAKWLVSHPEQAGRATVAQVSVALIDSFPCATQVPAASDPGVGR